MQIPVRKCYSVLKIAGLFGLVVTVLLLFEQWRGGQRSAGALFLDAEEAEFERQIREDEARIVPGLGDGGVGVDLTGKEKIIGEESVKKNAMNVYLSDRIPYDRKLKDERNPACARVVYDAELPSASVVIIFHNEPYSVVVRTIWSVLNSARRTNPWFQQANFVDANTGKSMTMGYPGQDPKSPFIYLKEIILVDDNSTLPELKGKLSHYVRTRLPPDLIRILRLPDRGGLTRARLAGARKAVGDTLIFLDSHCEVSPDWLRPLLHRIKEASHTVVVPVIDIIDEKNLLHRTAYFIPVIEFILSLHYNMGFFKSGGLTRARLAGARKAVGDTLIFLDSHCEVSPDWLRPLLHRIKEASHTVVVPVIDIIVEKNLLHRTAYFIPVIEFILSLHYNMGFFKSGGLTRARLAGARIVVGDTLIFLDSHCEVTPDWLRPLLHRIKEASHAVVVPVIDIIDEKNLLHRTAYFIPVIEFILSLHYNMGFFKSVGLTRARLAGARYAVGDTLIFLDSHCEMQPDWLRPLLHRVKEAPHAVVMPIIDVIEDSNFLYSVAGPENFQGLMQARTLGARLARGDALVFLDAHCEALPDWLRPLLQRLKHKRDAVLTPLIDILNESTFKLEGAENFQVGGFTFNGHFTWVNVPEREKRRRGSDIAPTWSPTMAGGLFAIDRKYYWELGAYDEQMGGWGGENLEISFRIWMCGGTLETIPCSRVGHVFRAFHPYGLPYHTDTHGINTARMAEVWMDDYKELFYMHRPDLRKNPKIGDVTHRKVLREKLQCKSFQWYLDNIYKEKFVPVRDAVAYGRFRNPISSLCIDSLQRDSDHAPLGVYSCHPTLQASQFFMLSHDGELRDEESCAELTHYRRDKELDEAGYKVNMVDCGSPPHRDQTWKYLATLQLQHEKSGLCLDAGSASGADLLLKPCRKGAEQIWTVDYTADNHYRMADEELSMERDMKLNRIRGHRMGGKARVPRSAGEGGRGDHDGSRRRSHRGRHSSKKHGKRKRSHSKTKNKFILKLVRTLMNNTEEHLEVDIHCRHKRLYPNNTFVRDLVTILNEKNIKVINNGRVFERNRVTDVSHDLGRHKEAKILEKLDIPEPLQKPEPVQIPDLRTQTRRWRLKPRKKAAPAEPAPDRPAPADEKRIIVEDFIEVKPSPSTDAPVVVPQREVVNEPLVVNNVMREGASEPAASHASPGEHRRPWTAAAPDTQVVQQGHMKRRHKHVSRSTPEPSPPPVQETVLAKEVVKEPPLRKVARVKPRFHESEEDIMKIEQTSMEDAPMVSGEAAVPTKRDGYSLDSDLENVSAVQHPREDITTAEPEEPPAAEPPHRRSKHKHSDGHRKPDSFARQDYTKQQNPPSAPSPDGEAPTASPLKVVMRSNLTFNLGDEFFNWRGDDDVTNLVDELSIPRAPPAQAWLRAPPQRASAGASDATATVSSGGSSGPERPGPDLVPASHCSPRSILVDELSIPRAPTQAWLRAPPQRASAGAGDVTAAVSSGGSSLDRPGPDLVPASAYVTALRSRLEPHREAPGGAAPASYDEESESTSDSTSSEIP